MSEVRGIDDIKRILEGLPVNLQKNVVASGNRAVANAIKKEMQGGNLPLRLKKSAAVRKRRDGLQKFSVGLRKPMASLAHLFEFGTGPRFQKSGRYTGTMRAQPFMRPALTRIAARAEAIWTKAAVRNMDRQLKKLGR